MTLLVRPKRVQRPQRRREIGARHVTGQSPSDGRDATRGATGQRTWSTGRLSDDYAVYACQCGYVFEAPVSTSVDCPHCGAVQAW